MRKRFKGLTCVYCRERPAASDDHIFSRKLFPEHARGDLPKAPACQQCNNEKSKLELYLTAVLPMGSRMSDALDPKAVRRIQKNNKLLGELVEGFEQPATVFADGLVGIRTSLPFRARYLEEYLCMAAVGLAWHHFDIGPDADVHTTFFDVEDFVSDTVDRMFNLRSSRREHRILGNGVVEYRAVQAEDDPRLSIWQFRLLGGLALGSSDDEQGRVRSFVVLVGRREYIERLQQDQVVAGEAQPSAPPIRSK